MNMETDTRIQLSSIKPDIKQIYKLYNNVIFLTVFALENIVVFH